MTTLATYPAVTRRRPPWALTVPAGVCLAGMMVPLVYLVVRASEADGAMLRDVVFRPRTLGLLLNTLGLAAAVLGVVTLLAVVMAWLTTRADLKCRGLLTLLAVLPLAVPGYLMAYTLLAIGGNYGTASLLLGIEVPRLSGFWGALLALSLCNLPYMFLNLRVAMLRMDPKLEEVARSLGHSPLAVFRRVTFPRLRPSLFAGGLLIVLHVVGDFGVVGMLRYETFSYALYWQVESGDRVGAAWLGLMLIGLTIFLLLLDLRFLRGLRLDPAGMSAGRVRRPVNLGRGSLPAYGFLLAIAFFSLVVPVVTMGYWVFQPSGSQEGLLRHWGASVGDSLGAAVPAALLAVTLAVPIASLARRYPSMFTRGVEQAMYLGYATPSLAFALGFVVFAVPFGWIYQSMGLLVAAYALHFLAEAIGPIRTSLYVATPRMEEAARSLGMGKWSTFLRVTLPLLRPGIVASLALVFLSVMKELPISFILSPLGFQPLALRVWDYTNEAMFAEAAPYALTILLLSAGFVGLLLGRGYEEQSS